MNTHVIFNTFGEEEEEVEVEEEEEEEEDYHGPRLCLVAFCLKPASSLAKSHKLLLSRCQLHVHLAPQIYILFIYQHWKSAGLLVFVPPKDT